MTERKAIFIGTMVIIGAIVGFFSLHAVILGV